MPLVRGLVLAHVAATVLLLLAFWSVLLWQRLSAALRARTRVAAVVPYPAEPTTSAPLAVVTVRDWTIDLRAPDRALLQES